MTLTFQAGSDPDDAARSALTQWTSVFGSLPGNGSYRAYVSMIEAENGYYIAVDVEVLRAGSHDKDDPVTLTKIVLSGIYKTEYIVDETFDKTGLTVTAYYSNNTSKVVDNYSISPSGALTVQDDTVTITYEEYGQTASATISIAVTDPGFKMNGDTYEVYNADGLKAWAEAAKVDSSTNCTLTANIDLENQPWTPVGDDSNAYTGTFDGGKHTISGLSVNSSDFYAGLFGRIGTGGTVQNLTLNSPNVTSTYEDGSGDGFGTTIISGCIGGVAGFNGGFIENCHVEGGSVHSTISACNAGGVVGQNGGDVTGCYTTCSVITLKDKDDNFAGGVVGWNNGGSVTACCSTSSVSGYNAGGAVGFNNGRVTACYHANGTVEGTEFGGVAGSNIMGTVTTCYWSGTVDSGIGSNFIGTYDTTEVDGSTVEWTESVGETLSAMDAMNEALKGGDWQYLDNTASGNPPLTLKKTG